jgi:hypothetical protein
MSSIQRSIDQFLMSSTQSKPSAADSGAAKAITSRDSGGRSRGDDEEDDSPRGKKPRVAESVVAETEPHWILQTDIPDVNHAQRYMCFLYTVRGIPGAMAMLDIVWNGLARINSGPCILSGLSDNDNRVGLRNPLINLLENSWNPVTRRPLEHLIPGFLANSNNQCWYWLPPDRGKVSAHWIAMIRANKVPGQGLAPLAPGVNWEVLQASHICIRNKCVRSTHLEWETAAVNQSRGNAFCRRICTHAGMRPRRKQQYMHMQRSPRASMYLASILARVGLPS